MKKLLLAVLFSLVALPAAFADGITFTLASPFQSGPPGGVLTYVATVSAPLANSNSITLDHDVYTVNGNGSLDDTGFLTNFPLSLNPGDTYTGTLFTIALPSGVLSTSTGTFSLVDASNNILATVAFTAAATPEPSTWIMLATSLAIGAAYWRTRHADGALNA